MENFDTDGYVLNYGEIAKSKDMMAMTRLLATDLMNNPYLIVGDYIKGISDSDLDTLVKEMDKPEGDQSYDNLLLIAEMLATGEGCAPSETADQFGDRMTQLVTFLVCESLARKGLIKVFHDNMSFHEDMKDKNIAEKI